MHHNFVDGSWLEGVAASRNINLSNTDDVIGEYAQADAAQAHAAVAAAKAAFPGWRAAGSATGMMKPIRFVVSGEVLGTALHCVPASVMPATRTNQAIKLFAALAS